MAPEFASPEEVQEDNGVAALGTVAVQSPSPSISAKDVAEVLGEQDSSQPKSPGLQPPNHVREDNGVAVLDTMAVQFHSAMFAEDVAVVLADKQESSQSNSPELRSQPPSLSRVASSANFMEYTQVLQGNALLSSAGPGHNDCSINGACMEKDILCHMDDSALPCHHPESNCVTKVSEVPLAEEQVSDCAEPFEVASFLETSSCPGDVELLSMDESEEGRLTKERELNGSEGLWTEESALLSNRSEGRLTDESELHPEILEILHLLFSYSAGKPFKLPSSGLYNTTAKFCKCGYYIWFEKVATLGAGDELLVIVHWSNVYLFEGGLCLILGKGLASRNKKIMWQIQKCFPFGKKTPQEIRNLALKEGQKIVSAALSETNQGNTVRESHDGDQAFTEYTVISITGDGRCLFRAVAHGLSLRCGNGAPDESQQLQLADDLRQKVADELVNRRGETEWFIEGDFDVYVSLIRQPCIWGGEPELLMLTHLLEVPITVYLEDQSREDGIIAICKYGQEYGTKSPIRVLYDGLAHYEALQINSEESM